MSETSPVPCNLPDGQPDGKSPVFRTRLHGVDLLFNSRLNKGTAFTEHERNVFGLHGLLPPHIGTLEDQRVRRKRVLDSRDTAFGKYSNMRDLQDNDETLFYSMIEHYTDELLPIVYTPAVGEGCQRFSEIWRRPRGLFISYPNRHRIDHILADKRYDDVRCIVVSDGERILGLGDQGAGGMGIPIGKMALYTALGGIPPKHCLPILLDAGTDNEKLLNDPIYIGWQHNRVRGQEYDDFVEAFVTAVQKRWPKILLQWEDFAGTNAARLLERYRDRLCTFNDDIQGTAAVTTATLLAAVNATGIPLSQQTIAMFGAGSAGIGIIDLLIAAMKEQGLTDEQARSRIYAFNRYGLLVEESARHQGQPNSRWCASAPTLLAGISREAKMFRFLTWCATQKLQRLQVYPRRRERSPKRSCAKWHGIPKGRLFFHSRTLLRSLRRHPRILCGGRMAARWSEPVVRLLPSKLTASWCASRR